MNKQYKELSYLQKKQYWALMDMYLVAYAEGGLSGEKEDNFLFSLGTLQRTLGFQLFTERSHLDEMPFSYAIRFGTPFTEVFKKPNELGTYINFKEDVDENH